MNYSASSSHFPNRIVSRPLTPVPEKHATTIAISGCSSSGKTTLALILAEIFAPETPVETHRVSVQAFLDSDRNKDEVMNNPGPVVVHQDAYFKDKKYCPDATFLTTPGDRQFVLDTISSNSNKKYTLQSNPNFSNSCQETGLDKEEVPTTAPSWLITGPDTDCWEAMDCQAIIDAVQHVQATGDLSDTSKQNAEQTSTKIPGLLCSANEVDTLLAKFADLVTAQKKVLKEYFKKNQELENLSLCFVEGFLLFSAPGSAANLPVACLSKNSHAARTQPLNTPTASRLQSTKRSSVHAIFEAKKSAFQTTNNRAKGELLDNFDIKMFLPTSMEAARKRRFGRDIYIDHPAGKRQLGQLWKTEGYFNDVAWGNYRKEHSWLFSNGNVEGSPDEEGTKAGFARSILAEEANVHIRPIIDASVEDSVEWAVRIILEELGKMKYPTAQEDVDEVDVEVSSVKEKKRSGCFCQ